MHLDGEVYHSWPCLQETFVTKIDSIHLENSKRCNLSRLSRIRERERESDSFKMINIRPWCWSSVGRVSAECLEGEKLSAKTSGKHWVCLFIEETKRRLLKSN